MKKYRNKHLNDQLLYPIRFLGQNIILQTIYFMRRFYHCKILVSRPISLIEMNLDLEES